MLSIAPFPLEGRRVLLLAGSVFSQVEAKTAVCYMMYRGSDVVAVYRPGQPRPRVGDVLGFGGDVPVVEHNGDVYPCDFFVDHRWLLGNIHEDSFEELANSERFKEFVDQRKLRADCVNCPWLRYCNGGCQKHIQAGRNYFCESYKMFFEHADDKIQELKKA